MKKVGLNILDRAIAFVSPSKGVERLASRAKLTAFDYDATKYNRQRRGPSSLAGAEGFRSNYDRVELLKRSRDLAENVGLVRGLLMKFASHCAGNISYQCRTDNPSVNTDVEAYWNEWWDKCDLSGRHTGSFLMQIAMMSMLRDGDFLFALVRAQDGNLKLQGIEADRIGDPNRTYTSLNLIGGIHIDQETGAPVGYDIYLRTYGNAYIFQTTIPATQAFHLYDPLRIDQYRGISAFHTAINDCVDLYEIIASEKMAAKLASSQAGIVKRNNNNASDLSTLTDDLNADNQGIKLETIEPGKISYLEVNEDIVFPDGPSRPSGAFAEFHRILLRNICMGVGIPYSFAVDPSSMSGPTARLEMQQAGRTFRRYQKLLEDRVLRPLKNIVIADAVSRGLIENNLGGKSTKGIFNFGANVSIDLGRESQANISEFRCGLTTASSIYAEKGLDFESSMRQRALEAKLIKDLAEQYGVSPDTISDINKPVQAPAFGSPTPAPEQMQEEPQDKNAVAIVPPIKEQDTISRTTGSDGDIDVGEEREPTEKTATEGLEELDCGTGSGGFQPGNSCASGGGGGGGDAQITEPKEKTSSGNWKNKLPVENYNYIPQEKLKRATIDKYDKVVKNRGHEIDWKKTEYTPDEKTGRYIATYSIKTPSGEIKKIDTKTLRKWVSTNPRQAKDLEINQDFVGLDEEGVDILINAMLSACELGKYSEIDFTPPEGARESAKRALAVRGEKPSSQRGMTSVGIARARDLIAGKKLSPDTIRRMHSFFSRHEVDKKGSGWDDQGKGWQAWNGWGGDAGFSWVKKLVKQMDSRDKKLEEPASCPLATQDVKTNLANRQNAVDDANYGPANPNEPNDDYWKAKADEFQGDVVTAKKMLCGNCAAFNQTSKLLGCIKKGIGEDANEVAVGGNLGYCEIFDFKCASKRTCDAWIVGGPITDDKKSSQDKEDSLPSDPSEIEYPIKKKVAEFDCGTGSGGFKEGNTCAGGGSGTDAIESKSSTKISKVQIAPEVLPGQKWGDNGQEFTEDGRAVRAKIGDFTITDAEGGLQKGASGAVKRLGKKTKEDLEKALSEPETIEAMRAAGIDNIEVRGTSKTPSGFTYYGAHNKNNLIIHTKTSEAIAASGDEYRVKHGFNRLIHHEIGHGIWDGAKEETKGNFTQAIKANPKVIEEVAKRTRMQYSRGDVWDESKTDRTVTESFAELNGMKRFDKEGYSKLPQGIKDSIDGVEKEAKELRASLAKRGRIGPVKKSFKSLDCGTGAGGFQPGNSCASGGGETEKQDDYKGIHRPPSKKGGAPLNDLTGAGEVYPDDIYGPKASQYYGTGMPTMDRKTISIIQGLRGKPDAEVTIYRAIPNNVNDKIKSGDWITVNRDYAVQHGESTLRGNYKIASLKAKASDIFGNGDSIHEYGYDPQSTGKSNK